MKKRIMSLILTVLIICSICIIPASAKTITSAKADNIFFYALNSEGKSMLLKVMSLDEVKKLAHGQADGQNYYISTTDNYPTTQYCEARGFTVIAHRRMTHDRPRILRLTGFPPFALLKCLQSGLNHASATGRPLHASTGSTFHTSSV